MYIKSNMLKERRRRRLRFNLKIFSFIRRILDYLVFGRENSNTRAALNTSTTINEQQNYIYIVQNNMTNEQKHEIDLKKFSFPLPFDFTRLKSGAAGGIIFTALCLVFYNVLTSLFVYPVFRLLFGTLYPAYASYKAVKTKNVKEYVSK